MDHHSQQLLTDLSDESLNVFFPALSYRLVVIFSLAWLLFFVCFGWFYHPVWNDFWWRTLYAAHTLKGITALANRGHWFFFAVWFMGPGKLLWRAGPMLASSERRRTRDSGPLCCLKIIGCLQHLCWVKTRNNTMNSVVTSSTSQSAEQLTCWIGGGSIE